MEDWWETAATEPLEQQILLFSSRSFSNELLNLLIRL